MPSSLLAIHGGDRTVTVRPQQYPTFSDEAIDRVSALLRHELGLLQGLSKHHEVIREFEEGFAAYFGVENCLAASSGHGALQSALIGLEIADGDHVLTSPYSWGASVSCILHNGAVPVFADVDPETGLLDPDRLGDYITPATTAVLVPHIFGQPSDMTAIMAFAAKHGLAVVEDGSQAHGAVHRGRRLGSFGDASGYSTNGVKPIATTEGGFMLSKDKDVYWKASISCQHAGRSEMLGRASEPGFPDDLRPFIDSLVYTYRPNTVSAILALDRLPFLDAENANRARQAQRLFDGIADIEFLSAPRYAEEDVNAFHMVTLNFDAAAAGFSRDELIAALNAEGVGAVSYVETALNKSPRLSPDWSGPKVMWTETIRRSGIDPNKAELPGTDSKVAGSLEIPWNFVEDRDDVTDQIIEAFHKVAANAGRLRSESSLAFFAG